MLGSSDLARVIKSYIEAIPEERRTEEPEYLRRLAICENCSNCNSGLCGCCGCFVTVRAAKKDMDCPNVGASKWKT